MPPRRDERAAVEPIRSVEPLPEKLVKIELVKGYVPRDAEHDHDDVFLKHLPGEVIDLPASEAREVVRAGIGQISLDMIGA